MPQPDAAHPSGRNEQTALGQLDWPLVPGQRPAFPRRSPALHTLPVTAVAFLLAQQNLRGDYNAAMSAPNPGISFIELLAYVDYLASRWLTFFRQHPEALELEVGGDTPTIADLILHLIETEEVFARFLYERQPPETFPPRAPTECRTADNFLRRHQEAVNEIATFLAGTNESELRENKTFGPLEASRRKLLAQAMLHSVHHWAQVAMLMRRAGFDAGRPQDLILTDVMA
jgi:uncharacterized damage-inducible protein DinB